MVWEETVHLASKVHTSTLWTVQHICCYRFTYCCSLIDSLVCTLHPMGSVFILLLSSHTVVCLHFVVLFTIIFCI